MSTRFSIRLTTALCFLVLTLSSGCKSKSLPSGTSGPLDEATKARTEPAPTASSQPSTSTDSKELALDLGGGVKMELVLIPAGEFLMGSPESEEGHEFYEAQHRVRISKPFYLGKYEVTQAQWQAVMGNNPSWFSSAGGGKDQVSGVNASNHPVERVSWDDCQEFCRKLSAKTGVAVRLPTEAEWEYACRAGSTSRFCFGNSDGPLGEYAWYESNSGNKTHPVGGRKPNAWGLYDMHGNVWEWCADGYGPYPSSSQTDPPGASTEYNRVLRGGSWGSDAAYCRSAHRNGGPPDYRSVIVNGFRVVAGT